MDLVTGAMGNLAPKLEQLLGEEYKLQKGLRKQVQSLSRKLETIHAVLRKVGDVPPDRLDKQVRIWCREVREASYDMEDVLDTFLISVDGRETADMNGLKRALKRMGDLFSQAKALHDIAGAFEDIKKQPQEVPDRRARPKIDEIVARPAAATSVDPRLSALYTKASQLVGIDEPRDKIIEMMSIGEKGASSKEIKIITIVGSGGLGKTTLAKAVYDKVNRRFDCSAFVRVGHNCGPGKVLRDILVDLTSDNVMQLDEKQLIDELGVFLKGKRYLIVLDDMWDTSLWEIIRLALYGNGFGSRIITTTRNIDLARRSGGCYILKPLSFESSTKLFYGRIFGSQGNCPTEYKELSAFCLRKCGGVPLAIIVISGLLTNKIDNIKEWYDVCASIGSGLGSNPDMDILGNILSRSYYDLPSHLKACLLYLSIYPENYEIRKDQLIWRWIAEGLIQHEEEGKSLYEIGESFFYELANRSLIQPTQMTDEGTPWACCVHDMVLDLICCYAGEENFVTKQNYTPYLEGKVRRLALHSTNNEHSLGSNVGLEKLRSLNAIGCPMYVIPPVSSFKILRVLDLESCESMKGYDLKHLGKLLLLRFIGLRNTFVRKLPEEVGDLKFLQTLELEGSGVEELPASMATLPGLMCLNADWTTRVPDWIGKLTSVQQLVVYPGFSVDDKNSAGWFVQELGNLGELRVLRFVIEAQNEGQLRDLLKSLSSLQKIEVIDFDCYGVKLNKSVSFETADFSLCPNLRFLTVRRLEFSSLPASINPGCLPKLCHLWLKVSDVDGQDLEILGSFTGLVSLHLQIVNIEQGDVITCGSGAFQSLKFFSITIPLQFVYGAMPRLEVLDFHCNVRLLTDANHNFNFDFGLGNLHLLEQVIIRINCLGASPEELGKVEAAVNKAIHSHTNHPTSEIKLFGQHLSGKRMFFEQPTETLDADLSQILEKTDEPRGELIKMLLAVDNDAHDKKMKILSIVRSEGLGKTTLAQEVFDMLSPKFDCGSFVQVGKNADLRKVLTNILIGLDKQKYKDSSTTVLNLMELVALLRESLENKRYVRNFLLLYTPSVPQ